MSNNDEIIIQVEGFTKKFKNITFVDNIFFNVYKGSIHGFVGPNGSGKTTTIKSLIGAYTSNNNSLKINNYMAGSIEANKNIGYVPEKASFPANVTTFNFLKWMGKLSGLSGIELENQIEYHLKKNNLWEYKDKNPNTFSSGMQKKVLLIQAILHNPKLLILDEPTANLDPTTRDEVIKMLIDLKNEGKTILISSHILSELEKIIDSITFLYYGKILFSGSINDLYQIYGSEFILKTNNNSKVLDILLKHNFNNENIYIFNEEIIIKNLSDEQMNQIFKIILDNHLVIIKFQKSDLQNIYNHLISSAKK